MGGTNYDSAAVAKWMHRLPLQPGENAVCEAIAQRETPLVVDIGCGSGRFARQIHDLKCVYIGVDLEQTQLREFRAAIPHVCVVRADASRLPLRSGTVDVALLLFHVIEAVEGAASQESLLREAARVLRPGGSLFVSRHLRWRYRPGAVLHNLLRNRTTAPLGTVLLSGAPQTADGVAFDNLRQYIGSTQTLHRAARRCGFEYIGARPTGFRQLASVQLVVAVLEEWRCA